LLTGETTLESGGTLTFFSVLSFPHHQTVFLLFFQAHIGQDHLYLSVLVLNWRY